VFNPDAYALVSPYQFDDENEFATEPAGPEPERPDEYPVGLMQRSSRRNRRVRIPIAATRTLVPEPRRTQAACRGVDHELADT
jgi:hypothetical protein